MKKRLQIVGVQRYEGLMLNMQRDGKKEKKKEKGGREVRRKRGRRRRKRRTIRKKRITKTKNGEKKII